jgi:hypothetical protein
MKNIDRLTRAITIDKGRGILIHTVYGTKNWIVAEKIEIDKWILTLMDPMGSVTFQLGTVSNKEHLSLWHELIMAEIEKKTSQIAMAKELKRKVYNFKKRWQTYKKFTRINNNHLNKIIYEPATRKRNLRKARKSHERRRNVIIRSWRSKK